MLTNNSARLPQIYKNYCEKSCEGMCHHVSPRRKPGPDLLTLVTYRTFTSVLHPFPHGKSDLWRWGKAKSGLDSESQWADCLHLQILCHSTERNYIITNVPWLIGSLGTMIEDVTIFIQFRLYAVQNPEDTV